MIQAGSPCLDPIGVIVDDICSFSSLRFGVSKKSCSKAAKALATGLRPHFYCRCGWMITLRALLPLFRMIVFNKIAIVSTQKKKKVCRKVGME